MTKLHVCYYTRVFNRIKEINANRKVQTLAPFLDGRQELLDVGCGDLKLAEELVKYNSKLSITGTDVVDFGYRPSGIKFVKYDGKRLPFPKESFDTALVFHVLHHCDDPYKVLQEAVRVARKRVIVIEPVYRVEVEIPIMRFVDWVYNVWKERSIAMKYQFFTLDYWLQTFNDLNLKLVNMLDLDKYPRFTPVGRAYLFELIKKRGS